MELTWTLIGMAVAYLSGHAWIGILVYFIGITISQAIFGGTTSEGSRQSEYVPREETKLDLSDCYSALGISPSASNLEVKSAYRKLVMQYHPDHNTTDTTEQFLIIQNAYETILASRNQK